MGVNELPALLKQYGVQSSLVDAGLEGKVVAVDLMVVLHSALCGKRVKNCADQFWLEPPVPVTAVLDYVNAFYSALTTFAKVAEIIFVLDGLSPPPKGREGASRRLKRTLAETRLRELFDVGTSEDLLEIQALKRKTVYPRSDVVAVAVDWLRSRPKVTVISAPFEADGQLVQEEWAGMADLVISVDSDLYALGARWLVTDLHRDKKGRWQCCTVKRQAVLPALDLHFLGQDLVDAGQSLAHGSNLAELCSFLGTDYIPNISRWGLSTVTAYFRKFVVLSVPQKMAELVRLREVHTFNPASVLLGFEMASFVDLWSQSVCSLSDPPVFTVQYLVQDALAFTAGSRSGDDHDPLVGSAGPPLEEGGWSVLQSSLERDARQARRSLHTSRSGAFSTNVSVTMDDSSFDLGAVSPIIAANTPRHVAAMQFIGSNMTAVEKCEFFKTHIMEDGGVVSNRFRCRLVPLRHNPDGPIHPNWERGQGYSPSSVLSAHRAATVDMQVDHRTEEDFLRQCHLMIVSIKTCAPFASSLPPRPTRSIGAGIETLGYGSHLHMSARSDLSFWGPEALLIWLSYRRIVPTPASATLPILVEVVRRLLESPRDLDPDLLSSVDTTVEDTHGLGSYRRSQPVVSDEPVLWTTEGSLIFRAIRRTSYVQELDAPTLERLFGPFRSGVRNRAKLRCSSGHYDLRTLAMARAFLPDAAKTRVMIFKSVVTPSMKSGEYVVSLVFKSSTGEFVPSPASGCQCPHGLYFCSHMLGKLLLFRMVQHRSELSFESFYEVLPPPLQNTGNRCVPVFNLYDFDNLDIAVASQETLNEEEALEDFEGDLVAPLF